MRRDNLLAYDEYVPITTGPSPAFSSARMNAKLARYDQLAVMVLVDNLSNNTDGFDLWIAHSADNKNWIYLLGGTSTRNPIGDIHWDASTLSTTSTNIGTYLYGLGPMFDFVRFEMQFSSTHTGGHVRIYATQRDQGA
jgi:hypothetical protein